jgi:LuxR family maltose regulon positive regulatory protein
MPAVPGWAVIRPRIDKPLADGARGPLTSVTGPAGAGKTMAVAAWATSTSYPCTLAWLNTDDYDNRPRMFWSYVVAALRKSGIAAPQVVPGPGRMAVDHAFLVRLASALAAQNPPVVLVLDDFHLLTEPAVLDGLAYVLRNAWRAAPDGIAADPRRRCPAGPEASRAEALTCSFSMEESVRWWSMPGETLSVRP